MFIKLEFKQETKKAYQLQNNSWIPKSILDNRGLKHPYYQIQNWWLNIQVENLTMSLSELLELGRKITPTEKDILNSKNTLMGIKPMVISMIDIPEDIRDYWTKYWKSMSDGLEQSTSDYEPRLWGNDCFEGVK